MTHYDALGLTPGAAGPEIRQAYLRAARQHHPDLESDSSRRARSEQRMQDINAAWQVLGDPERRRRYDRELGLPEPGYVPHRAWVPVDDGEDEDLGDLLDDSPYPGGGELPRVAQLAPPMLIIFAVFAVLIGAFTAIPGLGVLGLVAGGLGALLFLAVPFFAVFRGHRGTGSAHDGDER